MKKRGTGSRKGTVTAALRKGFAPLDANPPKALLSLTNTQRFRFLVKTNQTNHAVLRGDILNLIGIGTNVANTLVRMMQSARVKSVEIWTAPYNVPGSSGVSYSAGVVWQGTSGSLTYYNDVNVANTATHLKSRPPKTTDSNFWTQESSNESEALFFLTAPIGSVVDLVVQYTAGSIYAGPNPTFSTTSTIVNHQFYFFSLDGTTGNIDPPVALSNTF
jgi:hypothetical protein